MTNDDTVYSNTEPSAFSLDRVCNIYDKSIPNVTSAILMRSFSGDLPKFVLQDCITILIMLYLTVSKYDNTFLRVCLFLYACIERER